MHFRPLSDELIPGAADALRNVDGFVVPLGFLEDFSHLVAYQDRWVLLVDRDNDRVGETVSLDELAELEWVSAFHRQGSNVPAVRQLQLLGVDVRVLVDIEGFASLPWFVKGTSRITMIQERLANRIAPAGEFRLLECPLRCRPAHRGVLVAPVAGARFGPHLVPFDRGARRAADRGRAAPLGLSATGNNRATSARVMRTISGFRCADVAPVGTLPGERG